jgi:hypothetical protein
MLRISFRLPPRDLSSRNLACVATLTIFVVSDDENVCDFCSVNVCRVRDNDMSKSPSDEMIGGLGIGMIDVVRMAFALNSPSGIS